MLVVALVMNETARGSGIARHPYPVTDAHGDAIGLVSVVAAERLRERRRPWVQVGELLADTPQPLALDADDEVLSVVPALARSPLHRAAVVRAGRLVGLVSFGDVVRTIRMRQGRATA